jgi:hypothetical protein
VQTVNAPARTASPASEPTLGPLTYNRLKATSYFHSCVYGGLLICAFALGKPQPETLIFGWAHGCIWIAMSLACIFAARMRIVPLKLAVAVAVLGGIGPFFGSIEFHRHQARRGREDNEAQAP